MSDEWGCQFKWADRHHHPGGHGEKDMSSSRASEWMAVVESERHYEGEWNGRKYLHFYFCPGHSIPHTPTPTYHGKSYEYQITSTSSRWHSFPAQSHPRSSSRGVEEEGHSELASITYYLQLPCLLSSCLDPSVHSTIHPYLFGRWIHGRLRYPQRTCMVTRRDLYLQQQQQLKREE